MRAARRIDVTSAGDVERRYWAPGGARAYAVPGQEQRTADSARRPGERTARGPKLTARETAAVLGLSQQELADLAASGLLRPTGPDRPEARRFPAAQVEAVLNGTAEPLRLVPVDGGAAAGPATSRGPRSSGDGQDGQPRGAGRPADRPAAVARPRGRSLPRRRQIRPSGPRAGTCAPWPRRSPAPSAKTPAASCGARRRSRSCRTCGCGKRRCGPCRRRRDGGFCGTGTARTRSPIRPARPKRS